MTINTNPTRNLLGSQMYNQINEDILKYQDLFIGGKTMEKQNTYLSTGNESLDEMLKGGYQIGKLTEISGATDTGKTLLALLAIKELQKQNNDKVAVFIDASRGMKKNI